MEHRLCEIVIVIIQCFADARFAILFLLIDIAIVCLALRMGTCDPPQQNHHFFEGGGGCEDFCQDQDDVTCPYQIYSSGLFSVQQMITACWRSREGGRGGESEITKKTGLDMMLC